MMNKEHSLSKITVVIPSRNNNVDLIDCIKSLLNLDYELEKISIIIWDNNSDQNIKENLKIFFNEIRRDPGIEIEFIESEVNLGGFTSRDELLKRASSTTDYILSLDDDVILPDNYLKDSLRFFNRGESIGMVGPRIVYDHHPYETAHGAGFINKWLGRYTTKDVQSAVECDYIIGCCMLIKKEVIDAIGGFDRDYYTSHGEVDFCLRAKQEGFKIVYDPSVVVRHRVDKGGTRTLERMYYVYRNKLLVIKKNWPIPQKWIALFIYSLLWFFKAIIDSVKINKKLDLMEIKTIVSAMRDGWLNRFGKRL